MSLCSVAGRACPALLTILVAGPASAATPAGTPLPPAACMALVKGNLG
jgi:hypothetical protein